MMFDWYGKYVIFGPKESITVTTDVSNVNENYGHLGS